MIFRPGRHDNAKPATNLSQLRMLPFKTILIPTYEADGPFGAKSVSEIGINGPQPAIANAIYDGQCACSAALHAGVLA